VISIGQTVTEAATDLSELCQKSLAEYKGSMQHGGFFFRPGAVELAAQ